VAHGGGPQALVIVGGEADQKSIEDRFSAEQASRPAGRALSGTAESPSRRVRRDKKSGMGPRFPAERFGFACRKPENFALAFGIRPDSHYCSGGNDTPSLPAFDVGGVDPEIGPLTPPDVHRTSGNLLQWSKFMGINPSIGRFRKACTRSSISSHKRDTWLFETPVFVEETVQRTVSFSSSPHCLDQVIDGARRDAFDEGLLE